MNRSALQPFHFITDSGNEVWIFHFLWNNGAQDLHVFCRVLLAIEAICNVALVLITAYLVYKSFRFPPVHMNLVIITNYGIFMVSLLSIGRLGQILFQAEIVGDSNSVSTPLLIFSYFRMTGTVTVTLYGIVIYSERRFALLLVRDYERKPRLCIGVTFVISEIILSNSIAWLLIHGYIPGYPFVLLSIIPHAACFFLIKRLLIENEKRLEQLNSRDIRRPTIQSITGVLPRIFFGDSTKDMYTLSLRLQLDENIWCCKQLARGNHVFLYGMVLKFVLFGIPPLFNYSDKTEWILHGMVAIANLAVSVASLAVEMIIAWSLDKLRPNVFPIWIIRYFEKGKITPTFEEKRPVVEETNNYFDQLSQQWERAFPG